VREGDLAIFLSSGAVEIVYEGEKYFIVPQSAILMLERNDEL
jgi:co-chaperonin GroES (HSP10)